MATFTPLAGSATLPSAKSSLPASGLRLQTLLVYWHLLSLDAPTVAMLWTWFIAKTFGTLLPVTSILAMGVAVWMLYAADRLLDSTASCPSQTPVRSTATGILASRSHVLPSKTNNEEPILSAASPNAFPREAESKEPDDLVAPPAARTFPPLVDALHDLSRNHGLEPRHLFHGSHRPAFLTGIALALLVLAFLIPYLPEQSLGLYSVLGTLLVAYFALIHLQRNLAPRLPKEIAVGVFFSAATFIPTVARNPALRGALLPAAVLFGLTCTLNCLFIYVWEHAAPFPEAHPATRFALRALPGLACVVILVSSVLALPPAHWQLLSAIAAAAALLLILHANRRHLDPTTLRAAADLCLLTPAVVAFAFT